MLLGLLVGKLSQEAVTGSCGFLASNACQGRTGLQDPQFIALLSTRLLYPKNQPLTKQPVVGSSCFAPELNSASPWDGDDYSVQGGGGDTKQRGSFLNAGKVGMRQRNAALQRLSSKLTYMIFKKPSNPKAGAKKAAGRAELLEFSEKAPKMHNGNICASAGALEGSQAAERGWRQPAAALS